MLTCLEWGRVDCLELERNKRSERSMIDGQGVVSHQRDRRSRGCSRPDAGRLPVICSLLCTPNDRLSRNYDQSTNVKTHSQPPKPGLQGARDRQQLPTARAGARCAAPAGSARPGLARGRSPGSPAGGGAGGASVGCWCLRHAMRHITSTL